MIMKKLFILDASGYIYRSYFAIRQLTNGKGESTNALYGFVRSVLKLIKDFEPTHLVSVFDGPRNAVKRTAIYADYKAHRAEMPGDLLHQIMWSQQFCQLMGIPELMIPEVEADDTMGSVAVWAATHETEVFLCTSDKDMCQLVNDKIHILNTFKENLILDPAGVEAQFGVKPTQIIDYLSITGDASDNVPGLSGFGPKTASELLKTFGTLDYILDHPLEVPGKKKQETIINEKEKALISRQLVTIDKEVPIPEDPEFYKLKSPSHQALNEFYASMNFMSLIREMENRPAPLTEEIEYKTVDDEEGLKDLIKILKAHKEICVDTETTNIKPLQAELVGIGLGIEPKRAWYVPCNGKLGLEKVVELLKPLFSDSDCAFYGHNIKYDYHVLANHGIYLRRVCFDTMIASYLLNSHSRQHGLDALALEQFNKVKIPIQDLIGKGKNQISMNKVPIEKITAYCCEDVDYTVRLKELLEPQLVQRGLMDLFKNLELPLLAVLAKMERKGIYVDCDYLRHLGREVVKELKLLEEEIYFLSGETFNLNSPKQLGEVLEKIGIKSSKKTATGQISTSADVLDGLRADYPIVGKILEYRGLEKLRSTYIESLPDEVNPRTGRVHCTFNQSVAATGRLSCQDPNLQNIPIRTEMGRKIREAFKPEQAGWSFLSADYSQIELRLLAHLSDDPTLIQAFANNEDIHRFTAAAMFEIPLSEVSPEQRFQAKAINFGIIYGQQAFGLSQELGIDVKRAASFIDTYFKRYNKVKEFLEGCRASARLTGRAVTTLGRERLIPEINSKNAIIRNAAERLAINTPLQGMSADLIKMAMLEISRKLDEMKSRASLLLQIHDELIFELPDEEIPAVQLMVKETMEGVMKLKVPLVVDIHLGKNWKEC